jgi:hypothetical protein
VPISSRGRTTLSNNAMIKKLFYFSIAALFSLIVIVIACKPLQDERLAILCLLYAVPQILTALI